MKETTNCWMPFRAICIGRKGKRKEKNGGCHGVKMGMVMSAKCRVFITTILFFLMSLVNCEVCYSANIGGDFVKVIQKNFDVSLASFENILFDFYRPSNLSCKNNFTGVLGEDDQYV